MGDLRFPEALDKHLDSIVEWKNLFIEKAYGSTPIDADDLKNI